MPSLPPSCAVHGLLMLAAACALGACGEPARDASVPSTPAGPRAEGAEAARAQSAAPARPGAELRGPALDARLELALASKPEGLVALDLDRDGRDELIVLGRTPGRLTIFSRLPQGWQLDAESRDLAVGDYALGPVVLGAGGEAPRIAFASRSTRELVLLDPLALASEPITARHTLASAPRAICSGVLDDGRGERVVVACAAGTLVHWNADGPARVSAIAETEVSCLYLLADGSGLLVGDQGARSLTLYGTDVQAGARAHYQLAGMPRALLEYDVDASGDEELVVAGGDRALWVFGTADERGADGWFDGPPPLDYELDRIPLRLARGDVSGDGHDDVIALFFGQLSYRVLSWTAEPLEVAAGYAGQAPWGLASGDFDGDGRVDLAIANRDARRVGLLYGAPGSGLRRAQRFATGRAPHSLALLRATDGGAPGIAVIHSLEDTWAVYTRDAQGWRASARLPSGPGANHLRALDLDLDGRQELAWTSTDARGSRLVFASAPGSEAGVPLPLAVDVGRAASDLVIHDLDGDGVVEALVCDEEAHALRWVHFGWDDAAGRISASVSALELPAAPTAAVVLVTDAGAQLAVGCADARGGSGIAIVGVRDGRLELVEFASCERLPIDLAAADVTGDGRPELFVLSKATALDNGGSVELWLKGEHWSRVAGAPTGQRPYALAAADWSGDGRAEVVVSAQNSHNVGLWRVVGDARQPRLERQADLGAGLGPLDLLLEDLDGDGLLELIVAGAFSDDVSVISRRP